LAAAGVISLVSGALDLRQAVDSATESMSRLLPTIVILVLAWTLSATMKDLQLGEVAVGLLRSAGFDEPGRLRSLPACIFLAACVVSFATGTSWGTMGILCPAAVTIAAGLVPHLPPAEAQHVFYASVGAVLAGAVFGDHCSPISDTTVLSSLASGCSLEAHVWTQMPYALVVAAVALLCGDVLVRYTDLEAWAGLLIGSGMLLVIVLAVGRRPSGTLGPNLR
jgi:Na+/H+ antiporter NhaC